MGNGQVGDLTRVSTKQFLQQVRSLPENIEVHSTCTTERIRGAISMASTPSFRYSATIVRPGCLAMA